MKLSRLVLVLPLLTACASSAQKYESWEGPITGVIAQAKRPDYETPLDFGKGKDAYRVLVHSPSIRKLLRERYSRADRDGVRKALSRSLEFALDSRGLPQASDRGDVGSVDPTHYDAVWVRDSLWVYLALKTTPSDRAAAKRLLLSLADYFASPAQAARFEGVIENPALLLTEDGGMNAPHVRFDRKSPEFADVSENGQPQHWDHKQNDALGLFLDLFCRALLAGEISRKELTPARVAMVGRFPRYFKAAKFEKMVDAGSWEEIERINTSSIAMVTSGLERLEKAKRFFPKIKMPLVNTLIDKGYETIRRQLAMGGESPAYPKSNPRFREGDAALLNLIYPAKLSRLKRADYVTVLHAVSPLIGQIGIKRYLGDAYQAGNFWFMGGNTEETSTEESFSERASKVIPGSEAQWFFDSWYSVAMATLAKRYHDERFAAEAIRFLNRSLGQVTGGTPRAPILGGDGKPVPSMAVPESYNTCINTAKERVYAPSPITPLNWAKASLRLALAQD